MRYLIIENLMGGVAWIHHDFADEQSAIEKFKSMDLRSSSTKYQLLTVTESRLAELVEAETLDYIPE
jgi:hypothetical protein